MQDLQQITNDVLHRVEQVTGVPVLVRPDPSLQLLANMKMARGSAPAHLISYNPRITDVDYLICYQCGFILRIAATPERQRFGIFDCPCQQYKFFAKRAPLILLAFIQPVRVSPGRTVSHSNTRSPPLPLGKRRSRSWQKRDALRRPW